MSVRNPIASRWSRSPVQRQSRGHSWLQRRLSGRLESQNGRRNSVSLLATIHAGIVGLGCLAAALLALSTLDARFALAQDDWPEFRGPTGQGLSSSTGLPTEWAEGKNVVWKQEVPGLGWSSPVIVGGRIYLTSAVPVGGESKDLSLRVLAFDAAKGKPLWNEEVFLQSGDAPKIHGKNSHASPTVIVNGDRLFVHFGHMGTACLDLNGKVVWKNNELKYSPVHGNGGTPALVGNQLLVFSCDGASDPFVVALEQATGKVKWKTIRVTDAPKKFSFSTPLVITVEGQQQIISPGSDCVCAFDPADGKELWRVKYKGYSVIPRPVYGNDLLYLSTSYDSPSILAVKPTGKGDVTETHVAWTTKKSAPHTPSLLLLGSDLFAVSDRGTAICLDAKTGEEIWEKRLGGNYSASPLYAEGNIYFQSEQGEAIVIKASREYQELARNNLGQRTLASYGVTGKALIIRTDTHLYRIEKTGGAE